MITQKELIEIADLIAAKTAKIVLKELRGDVPADPEYISVKEAARILGVTPGYMRQIQDRYPHKRMGDVKQSRLMFEKSALLKSFD